MAVEQLKRKEILAFLKTWPAGHQMNIYQTTGFNVVCENRGCIESVTDESIKGVDAKGRRFLLPIGSITLLKYSLLRHED